VPEVFESLLSLEDVARVLNLSLRRVEDARWRERVGLRTLRVGVGRGRLKVHPADLRQYVETLREGGR